AQGVKSLDKRMDGIDRGLSSEAKDLSRAAATLDQLSAGLAVQIQDQVHTSAALDVMDGRVSALEIRSRSLVNSQAGIGVDAARERARRRALAEDVSKLQSGLASVRADLSRQSGQIQSAQTSLQRIDSMDELLTMVQQDVEANDEELAEAKQALKRLETPSDSGPGWWRALVDYKYLPIVATGLAVAALGVAATQH
ncbi:MAG: hypothetical protein ACREKE_09455, partial [bacterium]